jgi:SAM-dependent methyltransferase
MSRVGESWGAFYRSGNLSWYDPSTFRVECLLRLVRSPWVTRLLDATDLRSGSRPRILDAGCGTGQFAIALALAGCQVHAFDYNEEALAIARHLSRQVAAAGFPHSLELYRDDLLAPRSPAGAYDLVFNQAVLEYFCLRDERRQALETMTRLARLGGWVAVIVQHTGHPFRPAWARMGWSGYAHQPPVTCLTPRRLARGLRASGLEQVRTDGINPWKAFFCPPWYRRWQWAERLVYLLGRFLDQAVPLPRPLRSRLALQILGVGRKPALAA